MNKPIISVVLPCYNAEQTIAFTIHSVLSQSFTEFELLIINDGSTDGTLDIIEQFADERIQVFSFANAGPQKSRNRGIEKSRGQYIALIDADDLWTPDKLADQYEALQNTPAAAVAYSWTDTIDVTGAVIQTGRRAKATGDVFDELLTENFLASGSNPLICAEAMRVVGGFDETILAGQDWDMYLTLAAQYSFVLVPKTQILYRKALSTRSWSSNLRRQEKGLMQVMKKHVGNRRTAAINKSAYLANCYRYLLFECFDKCAYTFQNGLLALRYFGCAVWFEPWWWIQRYRLIGVVLLKSARYFITVFPRPENVPA